MSKVSTDELKLSIGFTSNVCKSIVIVDKFVEGLIEVVEKGFAILGSFFCLW